MYGYEISGCYVANEIWNLYISNSKFFIWHFQSENVGRGVQAAIWEVQLGEAGEVLGITLQPVFRRRIHRIHMFLGLPDPDPLVRGMDPYADPSIIKQN
jgi:hypothetical protein